MPELDQTSIHPVDAKSWSPWPLLASVVGLAFGFVASIALVNFTMWLFNIVRGNDFWFKGSPAPFLWGWPLFAVVCMAAGWRWCGFAARKRVSRRQPSPPAEPLD